MNYHLHELHVYCIKVYNFIYICIKLLIHTSVANNQERNYSTCRRVEVKRRQIIICIMSAYVWIKILSIAELCASQVILRVKNAFAQRKLLREKQKKNFFVTVFIVVTNRRCRICWWWQHHYLYCIRANGADNEDSCFSQTTYYYVRITVTIVFC